MYVSGRNKSANLFLLLGVMFFAFSGVIHPYVHHDADDEREQLAPLLSVDAHGLIRSVAYFHIQRHHSDLCPVCNGTLIAVNTAPPEWWYGSGSIPHFSVSPSYSPFSAPISKHCRAPPSL